MDVHLGAYYIYSELMFTTPGRVLKIPHKRLPKRENMELGGRG